MPPSADPATGEIATGDDTHVRPFAAWLTEQSQGRTHNELSDALHDLIARVTDTGKKGALTLVVNVEPMKGDASVLVISDEIKLKLPEHDRKASMFFVDRAGNLSRNDPRQQTLPLREVSGAQDEPKDIAQ